MPIHLPYFRKPARRRPFIIRRPVHIGGDTSRELRSWWIHPGGIPADMLHTSMLHASGLHASVPPAGESILCNLFRQPFHQLFDFLRLELEARLVRDEAGTDVHDGLAGLQIVRSQRIAGLHDIDNDVR